MYKKVEKTKLRLIKKKNLICLQYDPMAHAIKTIAIQNLVCWTVSFFFYFSFFKILFIFIYFIFFCYLFLSVTVQTYRFFCLCIYPPDAQESDGGAYTQDKQIPQPAFKNVNILLFPWNFLLCFFKFNRDMTEI